MPSPYVRRPANGERSTSSSFAESPPAISLPKGGGAIRDIGEKFAANPVTGTGSTTVPLPLSPARSGFAPQLALSYDSGAGNGPFGFGWHLSLPSITRKTDKGLPRYQDAQESDTFILAGAEDLVPVFKHDANGEWLLDVDGNFIVDERERNGYRVRRYCPRKEGSFARIERWTRQSDGDVHWRSITKDNVTTLYGKTHASRIADPNDSSRVFRWLICASYDDKGNAIVFEHAREDDANVDRAQVNERNRVRTANRYLKRVRYGNRAPNRDANWQATDPAELPPDNWMFEIVLDYGEEHYFQEPPDLERRQFVIAQSGVPPNAHWLARPDPFSTFRSGFEIRTHRLCQRVLMFHHFPDELGIADCLVRSTEFEYDTSPFACFLKSVTQSGYVRAPSQIPNRYLKKSMPPTDFSYSKMPDAAQLAQLPLQDVETASMENLPYGLDGARYQWIDLDGEGISGILSVQADAWFYKRNLSPLSAHSQHGETLNVAQLAPVEMIPHLPNVSLANGHAHFTDLAGDGVPDVVTFFGSAPGFYEHAEANRWQSFRPFVSQPNIDFRDSNLKLIDLDGDGRADLLITEGDAFYWYPSFGEEGFGSAQRVSIPIDKERTPRMVFADNTQSIFLADMSGDGLSDVVRLRNGEVCYWPNLGYGRFGAQVMMDNAPRFDAPDQFDQQRIRLADIDGSGVTDIVYFGREGVSLYFNQSGNSWSAPNRLPQFPRVDDLAQISVIDLLGNGTACLVWSSPLPDNSRRAMRYIDLMRGEKPHLLVQSENNLGAETRLQYASSTKFYLQDKRDGKPWITKLPFPVHVVERVETYDHLSRKRFVTRYSYHHGYFDGAEREFRGFGMIEQIDTEEFRALVDNRSFPPATNLDAASHVPPVLTRTWFHTGAYLGGAHVSDFYAGLLDANDTGEYYREPGLDDAQTRALLLDDTILPEGLTADEEREACRALKGTMLRQEVYALDGTEKETHPYVVTEQNMTIRRVQPRGKNRNAIFFTHAREALTYHYEREPNDPRIVHSLTLEVDAFGNLLTSATIAYGRRQPDPALEPRDQAKQSELFIAWTENSFTNSIQAADDYRAPLPCETRAFHLTGLTLSATQSRFAFDQVRSAGIAAAEIAYEQKPNAGVLEKRLVEDVRTLYRRDNLSAPLPLGQIETFALAFETYRLAITPGIVTEVYGSRVTDNMLSNECGYVHSEGDSNWWLASGSAFLSPKAQDSATQELAHARAHFFLPFRYRDPFGNDTIVEYDAHDLMPILTRDPLANQAAAQINYRVLEPDVLTDPNGNRAGVVFDALGMVVGTAVMGKAQNQEGDSLQDFQADLTDAVIAAHVQDPLNNPHAILERATTRLVYDLFAYQRTKNDAEPQPAVVYTLARETHDADLAPGEQSKFQHSLTYSDGFGREIQKKVQVEPGALVEGDVETNPRWVASGWTIFNNKGKPVRQYEPFFSATHHFEFGKTVGISPVLFYDPVGRAVATLHPNHTFGKVVFDAWQSENWDRNDTVLEADLKNDPDVGDFFRRLPDAEYSPGWYSQRHGGALGAPEQAAALKTAVHANTPTVTRLDSLGRAFLSITHNRLLQNGTPIENHFQTRILLDSEGNPRAVMDAHERVVMRYDYNMLGNRIHQSSMEAGERWLLNDIAGKPVYVWDSRSNVIRTVYDALRRPAAAFLLQANAAAMQIARTVYGEALTNPETHNLRGKRFQVFDQAGIVTLDLYDFKGNLLHSRRQLAREYKQPLDWSQTVVLETEIFDDHTRYDALNRPIEIVAPDASIIRPRYNEANMLERLHVNVRGDAVATTFVANMDYNAKGQRTRIDYGNGVRTRYEYDPLTFRLTHLETTRGGDRMQDLYYFYDPIGNITHMRDDAQQNIYFNNQVVIPDTDYTYDAIYRLIQATGREHIGQVSQPETTWNDESRVRLPHPQNGQSLRAYSEQYEYDAVGNFQTLIHQATNGNWTRTYTYNEPSQLEPSEQSNRLSGTVVGANATEVYAYDAHGNMTRMSHLPVMQWNYLDQLTATAQQVVNNGTPETTYYVYDASGQRTRKVTERAAAAGQTPTRKSERIYLGSYELYREYENNGNTVKLERETLHISDNKQRIALVETRTVGTDPAPQQWTRYQLSNHLGSANLELDSAAQMISYEEFYPFGSTSYQAVRSQSETPKRYRYTGMERDEESGLEYHRARYYAPWLGRWLNPDPSGLSDGSNLFQYARNNPIRLFDVNGADSEDSNEGGSLDAVLYLMSEQVEQWTRPFGQLPGGDMFTRTADRLTAFRDEMASQIFGALGRAMQHASTPVVTVNGEPAVTHADVQKAAERTSPEWIFINVYYEFAKAAIPVLQRGIAAVSALGHAAEAVGGAALCATLIGCVIGAPAIAHGLDNYHADLKYAITGEQVDPYTVQLLRKAGFTDDTSRKINTGAGFVLGTAGMFAPIRETSVIARVRSAAKGEGGSSSSLLSGEAAAAPSLRLEIPDSLFQNNTEIIAGFGVTGGKGLMGNTFIRRIFILENLSGPTNDVRGILRLGQQFEAEARAAGATELRIEGLSVQNGNIMRMRRVVEKTGGKVTPVGKSQIIIEKSLK